MKHLVVSLIMLCVGQIALYGQSHNMTVVGDKRTSTDSVSRVYIPNANFENIYVIHNNKEYVSNSKQIKDYETKEYALRQQCVIDKIEYEILRNIPVPKLESFLNYKFNPIICNLVVSVHTGSVKKVSFQIYHKISSLISNEDILTFERIILDAHFNPDDSLHGDVASFYWVIGRKQIREYLNSQNREK